MSKVRAALLTLVLLLLAACGGGATLKVTPESASTTASGDPITLTASGGAGSVTWSLSPELGSLSTTSGPSVVYTPPRRVESTQTVTVTASSGGASASATITVEPLIVDVNGVVLDGNGIPAAGFEVAVIGQNKVTTDSQGRFSYSGVVAPYAVAVQDGGEFYVYDGLTKPDPVVFAFSTGGGSGYSATLEGDVGNTTGGNVLGLSLVSSEALLAWRTTSAAGSTSYSANAGLIVPTAEGRLFALEWSQDADGNAADFTGYATYPSTLYLADGGTFSGLVMSLSTVTSSQDLAVNVNVPDYAQLTFFDAGVRFNEGNGPGRPLITHAEDPPSDVSFTVRSPGLSVARMQVLGAIEDSGSGDLAGFAWLSIPAISSSVALSFPPRPILQGPADGASIGPDEEFSWEGNPGTLNWVYFNGPVDINYYTAQNSARLPDLSAFGVSYGSGDSYEWSVLQMRLVGYCESLDDYTREGMLPPNPLFFGLIFGVPPTGEGYMIISPKRQFTIQ